MPLIAALLPSPSDRQCLRAAAPPHNVTWAESWLELSRAVRREPVEAVIADVHAEARKDGALRVYRFVQRFPLTPMVAWGDMDGRELFRVGKAGAAEVVVSRETRDVEIVSGVLASALGRGMTPLLDGQLAGRIPPEARPVVRFAAERVPEQVQVPDVAAAFGMSVSTLERRFERWGLPTPGRLLLWLRVLYGLHWLQEPGRSVESVSVQLGYSSGAAFRRALRAAMGAKPTPLRSERGFEIALEGLIAECSANAGARPAGVD